MSVLNASKGYLKIEVTGCDEPIRILGHGFWSPTIMDEHFEELQPIVKRLRRAGTGLRMIVDLRTSDVQSADTVERMKKGIASISELGDRTAIICPSKLAQMQLRRIIGSAQHEFFLSPQAAEEWIGGIGEKAELRQ